MATEFFRVSSYDIHTGIDGEYIAVDMDPVQGEKGVVWEKEIGVPPPKADKDPAANIYYSFEVTLSEPVTLDITNLQALGAAVQSPDGTYDPAKVGKAGKIYTINSWTMPDPRNLQLQDRGIFEDLFTADIRAKLAPIALSVANGEKLDGKQVGQLRNILLNSANDLFTRFETTYDPMLVSVFSLPYVDIATESLWYANIDSIDDGAVNFEARVINANGEVVDQIVEVLTADDSAPEATVNFETAEHAIGYPNRDGVFVATANPVDTLGKIKISSTVTDGDVGHLDGYLMYQILKIDRDDNPLSTWEPLTVENSMLGSDLWNLALETGSDEQIRQLLQSFLPPGQQLPEEINIETVRALLKEFGLVGVIDVLKGVIPFETVQALLTPFGVKFGADDTIESIAINAINKAFGEEITPEQYALYANLLGAAVEDLNLFPLTSNEELKMTMHISPMPKGEEIGRAHV